MYEQVRKMPDGMALQRPGIDIGCKWSRDGISLLVCPLPARNGIFVMNQSGRENAEVDMCK